MKTLCCVIALALVGPQATAPPVEPKAPTSMLLNVPVGTVGPSEWGTSVSVMAVLTDKHTTVGIEIEDKSDHTWFNGHSLVDPAVADGLADAIEAMAKAAEAGDAAQQTAGSIVVKVETDDNQARISFDIPPHPDLPAGLGRMRVSIDPDNAPTLAKLIRKASANAAWLTPRLKDLDLSQR